MDKRGLLFILFFLVVLISSCDSEPKFAPCQDFNCGDGICCTVVESADNCPVDCDFDEFCGDDVCNGEETCDTCSQDCGVCCGDESCNFEETCDTCSQDCGVCCGDESCNFEETCETCSQDCGVCCGDGNCNGNYGETCETCSQDCGDCPLGELLDCEIATSSPGTGYVEVLKVSASSNAHAGVVGQSSYPYSVWCYVPGIDVTSNNQYNDPGVFLGLWALDNSHVQKPTINTYNYFLGFDEVITCEVKNSCESDEFCVLKMDGNDNAHVYACSFDYPVGMYSVCCEEKYVAPAEVCGDDFKDSGEECDGDKLGGESCDGLGFDDGVLVCNEECTFDTSSCYDYGCGNNIVDPDENCDGTANGYCENEGCDSCIPQGLEGACIGCTSCNDGDNDPCTDETYYPLGCEACINGSMSGFDFDGDGLIDGDNSPCIANGYYLLEIYGHNLTASQNSDCSGPGYSECYGNPLYCNYVENEFRNCYIDITPGVPFFDWISVVFTILLISLYYLVDRKQKVL